MPRPPSDTAVHACPHTLSLRTPSASALQPQHLRRMLLTAAPGHCITLKGNRNERHLPVELVAGAIINMLKNQNI